MEKKRKLNAYESVINISSARRALPDNDQTYNVMKKVQRNETKLQTPESGPTPAPGHACPLGGRCFCIRYPVGRGRGPARF